MTHFLSNLPRGLAFLAAVVCIGCDPESAYTDIPFPENKDASLTPTDADIELADFELTFDEDFRRKLDVSAWDCTTRWIAHTPWRGDFGGARFADPEDGFPFLTRHGLLRIEARQEESGEWASGLLSSYNSCGEGFAQQFGYFEIRAMLPRGRGFWPAFWLVGVDRGRYTAEIDVFEHHGARPGSFSTTIHVHPKADEVSRVLAFEVHQIEPGVLYRGFNTFGVSVEVDDIVFYFNRKEVWRTPTSAHFNQPMHLLLNLAMDEDDISASTPDRAFMYVDYVRAYKRRNAERS